MKNPKEISLSLLDHLVKKLYLYGGDLENAIAANTDKDAEDIHSDEIYLVWMCVQISKNSEEWGPDKLHRWIGFVQGVMYSRGITTIDEERDRVRNCSDIEVEK